jgi:hypothetical protein
MRSDWSDFTAAFLTAGMPKPPATIKATMRASQMRDFEGAAVAIGVPFQPNELRENGV